MEQTERIQEAETLGRGYFRQGINCAECVLKTYMDMHKTGYSDDILRLASGFGGGIGHTKHICGAISGAVMALGFEKGRNPFETSDVNERIQELNQEVYPVFRDLVEEILDEYKTVECRELCAPHGDFEGRPRKKNCQQFIGYCCGLVEKYAAMEKKEVKEA